MAISEEEKKKAKAEYAKAWNEKRKKDPEVQKRRKEYLQRPEVMEQRRKANRANYAKKKDDPKFRKQKQEKDKRYTKKYFALEENRVKRRAYKKEHSNRPGNKEKYAAYQQKYLSKPGKKELKLETKRKWRANLTPEKREEILKKAREYQRIRRGTKRKCAVCGFDNMRALAVHHILERAKGGKDIPSNRITLCCNCHALVHANKIKLTEQQYPQPIKAVGKTMRRNEND